MRLFKYRPLNPYTVDLIREGNLWFSNLDTLNDPFEGDYYYPDDVIKAISKDSKFKAGDDLVGRVTRYLDEYRKALKREFYVLSLSNIKDDILMWSHYADQHNGVVVEIEMPDKPEHLGESSPNGLISVRDSILQKVKYSRDPVFYDPSGSNEDEYSNVITSKTTQWKYEEEYRVIIRDPIARANGIGVKINPPMIKRVYFGMRCTSETIDQAIREIGRSDIDYMRMYMRHGHFSLLSTEA